MGIICPIPQYEISSRQEYSCKKCKPKTYVHGSIVSVFLFLQSNIISSRSITYVLATIWIANFQGSATSFFEDDLGCSQSPQENTDDYQSNLLLNLLFFLQKE